jgi:hypothetical protein
MTLFLPYPDWLSSEARPWCCLRPEPPRLLDDTAACRRCAAWQPPHEAARRWKDADE